jgi:hypothetical protein
MEPSPELAHDGVVSPALSPFQAYKFRMLPWGEKCSESESRLSALRLRPRWRERAIQINKSGVEYYEACYQAHLEYSPERCEELMDGEPLCDDDERFIEECKAGLKLRLPQRVGIERELDWLSSNLNCSLPNLTNVPSLLAINCIMELRVNKKAREQFWSTVMSKRLSPGDTSKKSKSAVKEDVSDVEAENQDEDLKRRLFGEGE